MSTTAAITCREVVEQATEYLENALGQTERARFEAHVKSCAGCCAFLAQLRATIGALGRIGEEADPVESKFAAMELLRAEMRSQRAKQKGVPLGIGEAWLEPGAHLAYFWESEAEFAQALGFLEEGLRSGDHCLVFGHEEANAKILALLEQRGAGVAELQAAGRLSVVGGNATGQAMLANLGGLFQQALDAGAPMVRLLGNLGWGRAQWPSEDEILEFEARVTQAAQQFPCLILCMYDVRSVSGRVLLRGGLETHPATVCREVLRENPHFVPAEQFLTELGSRLTPGPRRVQ